MRALTLLVVAMLGCGHAAKEVAAPPVTLALVYPAQEVWVGNDEVKKLAADDPTRYPGALKAIEAALDKAELAKHTPPGSQGVVVTFDQHPAVRLSRRPIAELTGAALGAQDAYFRVIGNDLVHGISLAIDELERAPAGRHVLIVLSDGNDTDNESAKRTLAELKDRAAKLGLEVSSVIYRSALSADGEVVSAFAPSVTAASAEQLATELGRALARVGT